jgi:hypothetical protein
MKTESQIKAEIARLDLLRLSAIEERNNAKTECDHTVAHNLVMIYATQMFKLEWVLE